MNSIALCFVNSLDNIINQFVVTQAVKEYTGGVVDALREVRFRLILCFAAACYLLPAETHMRTVRPLLKSPRPLT